MRRLLAIQLLLVPLLCCPALGEVNEFGMPKENLPAPTSVEDVLTTNPIKLYVSADEPSSELPTVGGNFSLNDAVKVGLKDNLSLKQSERRWSGSQFLARAALGKFGPSASFNTFYSTSSLSQMLFFPNDTTVASSPMQPIVRGTSLSLIFAGTQPLLTGGRLMGGYRATRALERQASSGYKADSNTTALKVKEAYWEAAWYEARLRVDTDYAKTKEWRVSNIQARVEEGNAPRADLLREKAELARARTQVNDDYRDYNVALVKLKVALGINFSSLFFLKESLDYVEVPGDLSSYLTTAGKNRPELTQAENKVAELRARRMVARSKYAPQVNLYGLGSNISGSSPDGHAGGRWGGVVGVVGGITLFDSGTRLNELRAASNTVKEAELARQEVHQKVAEDVSIAWINLEIARKNVDLAKAGVVSAEEDQRLIHTRYLVGKSIELEDFESGVKLLQARLALLESIYKYRVAQARLQWASGVI